MKYTIVLCLFAAMLAFAGCGKSEESAESVSADSVIAVSGADTEDEVLAAPSEESEEEVAPTEVAEAEPVEEEPQEEEISDADMEFEETPEVEPDIAPDLTVILAEINDNIQPGAAGGSLRSTQTAADLLDFTMATEIDADTIRVQTAAYVDALSQEERDEYPDKALYVGEAIHTLRDGDGETMLSDAGVTDSSYPWTDAAFEKADAILQGAGI